ncbi:hypothetical protein QW131_16675 [Roseibium salinum]|nr:hypothetical protein [Roseibium salinum]
MGAGKTRTGKKIVAGTVGNTLEWYDFAIYGYLAPIIAHQFFSPTATRRSV